MIHIIWEFQITPAHSAEFEKIYGAQGAWVILFKKSKDYYGTTLLKDSNAPFRYLTIDQWENMDAFENFKSQNLNAYTELDSSCVKFILSEKKIGVFGT
jgi:heme-degrading monooxygenase HmoA